MPSVISGTVKRILSRRLQRRGEDDGNWELAVSRLIDFKEDGVRSWMHLVQSRINLRVWELDSNKSCCYGKVPRPHSFHPCLGHYSSRQCDMALSNKSMEKGEEATFRVFYS